MTQQTSFPSLSASLNDTNDSNNNTSMGSSNLLSGNNSSSQAASAAAATASGSASLILGGMGAPGGAVDKPGGSGLNMAGGGLGQFLQMGGSGGLAGDLKHTVGLGGMGVDGSSSNATSFPTSSSLGGLSASSGGPGNEDGASSSLLSGGGIGSVSGGSVGGSMSSNAGGAGGVPSSGNGGIEELLPLVVQLTNPDQREGVLLELSKKRESFSDLAPILWHTYGTVAALLQEIVSIYPLLSPPTLTAHASNRVCNALALLQCVASHPETRSLFLQAHVPLYLYPFLNTQSKSRPFEYLRLTSLGVIGALVKMDDVSVINFLLETEIIPLCLRIMETGSELSKTVATFIVQKILLDEHGLSYVCATAERFYAVSTVLNNMIGLLTVNPSVRLLKHIVRCYLRLSDNLRAREALTNCLPGSLRDDTFLAALRDDMTVKKWLSQLLSVIGTGGGANGGGSGMMNSMGGGGGSQQSMLLSGNDTMANSMEDNMNSMRGVEDGDGVGSNNNVLLSNVVLSQGQS